MIQREEGASLGQPASLKRAGKGRDAASDAGRGPGVSGSEGGAVVPGCCAPLTMRVRMPHHFHRNPLKGTAAQRIHKSEGAGEGRVRAEDTVKGPGGRERASGVSVVGPLFLFLSLLVCDGSFSQASVTELRFGCSLLKSQY